MGLELVEIVVDLERRFKISIADDDAVKFETVGDIYRYIIDRSGVDEEQVVPQARLAEDLGVG